MKAILPRIYALFRNQACVCLSHICVSVCLFVCFPFMQCVMKPVAEMLMRVSAWPHSYLKPCIIPPHNLSILERYKKHTTSKYLSGIEITIRDEDSVAYLLILLTMLCRSMGFGARTAWTARNTREPGVLKRENKYLKYRNPLKRTSNISGTNYLYPDFHNVT